MSRTDFREMDLCGEGFGAESNWKVKLDQNRLGQVLLEYGQVLKLTER